MAGYSGEGPSGKMPGKGRVKARLAPFAVTFFVTFGFWILFSGKLDAFHLAAGAISCTIVALLTNTLLFPDRFRLSVIGSVFRMILYLPWLLGEILKANLHLLYLTFHPRMMEKIDPRVIRFDTRLTHDFSRTVFANSITLTPGTITVYAGVMGRFAVHCIDRRSGRSLPGRMEEKIAGVFNE